MMGSRLESGEKMEVEVEENENSKDREGRRK